MKKGIYTLADEEFLTLLERAHTVFTKRNLPYMLVGGTAVQAHILNYIHQKTGDTIRHLVESPKFRLQDHLRATDDIDITLDPRKLGLDTDVGRVIIDSLDEIVGDGIFVSPSENHLTKVVLARSGLKRPVFGIKLDSEELGNENNVSFNLYQGPKDTNQKWKGGMREFEENFYFDFMERPSTVKLNYCSEGRIVELKIKSAEDLLATKIARNRPKDFADGLSLYRHSLESEKPIDIARVRYLLSSPDKTLGVPNPELVEKYELFERATKTIEKD